MNTTWKTPITINQDLSDEAAVLWNSTNLGADQEYIHSVKELFYIPLTYSDYISNYTAILYFKNFNLTVNGTVTGIEVELQSQRLSRIKDKLIQLIYNDQLIGENQKLDRPEDRQIYGSSTNTWGATLNSTIINDNSFGIAVQLESNNTTPFSELAYIDYVKLRVFYTE